MSIKKQKVLFFSEAVTLAHVLYPHELAKSLDKKKYEVYFAVNDRYNKLFDFKDLKLCPLNTISNKDFVEALKNGTPLYKTKILEQYVKEDIELIEKIKPDLIVSDFRLSLCVSAVIKRTPLVSIASPYWTPYKTTPFPLPDLPINKIIGLKIAMLLYRLLRPMFFYFHTRPYNSIRKKYGLKGFGGRLQEAYTFGDAVVFPEIPELCLLNGAPKNYSFIGPLAGDLRLPYNKEIEAIPKKEELIYIALGSSGDQKKLPLIIDTLKDLPYTLVVSSTDKLINTKAQKNVVISDFVNTNQILDRTKLVICNGGRGGTQQALLFGVPVIGIASNLDQYLNMQGVLKSGSGLLLRSQTLNSSELLQAVQGILKNNKYKISAQKAKVNYKNYKVHERFSKILENYL